MPEPEIPAKRYSYQKPKSQIELVVEQYEQECKEKAKQIEKDGDLTLQEEIPEYEFGTKAIVDINTMTFKEKRKMRLTGVSPE